MILTAKNTKPVINTPMVVYEEAIEPLVSVIPIALNAIQLNTIPNPKNDVITKIVLIILIIFIPSSFRAEQTISYRS